MPKERFDLITLRVATGLDLPSLWAMLQEQWEDLAEDGDDMTLEDMAEGIEASEFYVASRFGVAIAGFWMSDVVPDLHARIHFLTRPKDIFAIMRQDVCGQFLDRVFPAMGLRKINARAMVHQTQAMKILKWYRFFRIGTQRNEALMKGKPVDVVLFELDRRYWERFRKNGAGSVTGPRHGSPVLGRDAEPGSRG